MAASPIAVDSDNAQPQAKWAPSDGQSVNTAGNGNGADAGNGGGSHPDDPNAQPAVEGADYSRNGSAVPEASSGSATMQDSSRGEKQIKPNKVYIGGLPEHTRKEDLESCFGKIGTIVNIELKIGYGFVEFDSREAAEESVTKYHEGYFMGNKIRVELSHGGGRTAKYSNDPGACFKCGQVGHWARECPNHSASGDSRRSAAPLIDRIQPPRDYLPPPRDYPAYDYARYPPPRDPRFYDYPPPAPGRDYRRSPPPRDYRDFPAPAVRPPRDVDTFRGRPAPPPSRYDSRPAYYSEPDIPPSGYPSRYTPAPARDYYDRFDRRLPANDRFAPYPAPAPSVRTVRSPPPPRSRDEYDRVPPRDYVPPLPDFRGRPPSPPPSRFADYPPRAGSSEALPRYRRRSQSPPPRSGPGYDSAYPSGGPPYNGSSNSFAGNGYPRDSAASRGGSSVRDYPPARSRDGESAYRRL